MSFPARGRCRRRAGFVAQHPREEAASAPIGHTASMRVTAWRALGVRSGVLACPRHRADSGRARQSRGRQCRGALDPGLRPCGSLPSLVLAGHPALQGLGTVALGVSGCRGVRAVWGSAAREWGCRGPGPGSHAGRGPAFLRPHLPSRSLAVPIQEARLQTARPGREAAGQAPQQGTQAWPSPAPLAGTGVLRGGVLPA